MQMIQINQDVKIAISDLAKLLNKSENDVVREAVAEYSERIKRKKRLMSFAGALDKTEADNMLNVITQSRTNKNPDLSI